MQQQMAMEMQGNQMCQKPGNKPGGMKGMQQMQQELNDQITKMAKEGKSPGGKGGKDGKGGGMSKEAAQMAAKQAAIRKALEEMGQKNNKDGKGSMGDLEELARQMEQTEEDLVNKRLTNAMLQRQQEIMDKLLKAENAMKERDLDEKRKAQTAQQKIRKTPPEVEEYLKKRNAEIELYKTVPPALKPFYRSLVEDYFKNIGF